MRQACDETTFSSNIRMNQVILRETTLIGTMHTAKLLNGFTSSPRSWQKKDEGWLVVPINMSQQLYRIYPCYPWIYPCYLTYHGSSRQIILRCIILPCGQCSEIPTDPAAVMRAIFFSPNWNRSCSNVFASLACSSNKRTNLLCKKWITPNRIIRSPY